MLRGVWGYALTLPQLPAGSREPVPTGGECGCAGVETRHWPLGLHALPDVTGRVGGRRLSGGGIPPAWVRRVYRETIFLPPLPMLWARISGPPPLIFRRGGCGCGGPSPNTQRTLLQAGVACFGGWFEGVPGGRLVPP